jgi:hypothetical protein
MIADLMILKYIELDRLFYAVIPHSRHTWCRFIHSCRCGISSFGSEQPISLLPCRVYLHRGLYFFIQRFWDVPDLEYAPYKFEGSDHICSALSQGLSHDGYVHCIRIVNNGHGSADHCSGRVDFEKITEVLTDGLKTEPISRDETLNWAYSDIDTESERHIAAASGRVALGPFFEERGKDLGEALQRYYAVRKNEDLSPKQHEYLEVCYTIKDHDVAYAATTSRKLKLKMGATYHLELQMVGKGLDEKPKSFVLELPSWDKASLIETSEYLRRQRSIPTSVAS